MSTFADVDGSARRGMGQAVAIYAFGPFQLDTRRRVLTRAGVVERIGARAFDLLALLLENAGSVVARPTIEARIWPGITVDEAALRVHVSALRRRLDQDAAAETSWIQTVTGRGYGVSGPVVVLAEASPDAEPAPARRAIHNLPRRLTSLIGREAQIAAVAEAVTARRLVTLVAPGGMGKTVLALAAAERLLEGFDAVWLVDLAPIDGTGGALGALAAVLGLPVSPLTSASSLLPTFAGRRTLLVFDNCEHVVDEVAKLAEALLKSTADVHVLCTSREALGVAGEAVRRVPPLATAPDSQRLGRADIGRFSAIDLFAQRAADVGPFQLDEATIGPVAELCRRLDGMPLAIELAAALASALPVEVLTERLNDRLVLTAPARRTADARHQNLEALFDWSYERLAPSTQDLLCAVAVFRREFDVDAAAAVSGLPPEQVVGGLAELVRTSLLEPRSGARGGAFGLLIIPRAYALEKLRAGPGHRTVQRRHAEYALAAIAGCERDWAAGDRPAWIAKYGRMLDEIHAALDWALSPRADVRLARELAHAATPLWFRLMRHVEGLAYVERVLAVVERRSGAESRDTLALLGDLVVMKVYNLRRWGELAADIPRVRDLAARLQSTHDEMLAHWARWVTTIYTGRHEVHLAAARAFARLAFADGAVAYHVAANRMVGCSLYGSGDLEAAKRHLREVLSFRDQRFELLGVTRFQYDQMVSTSTILAMIQLVQGDVEAALGRAEDAVRFAEAAHHTAATAHALGEGPIKIGLLTGRLDLAAAALARFVEMTDGDIPASWQAAEGFQAVLSAAEGRWDEAAAGARAIANGRMDFAVRYGVLLGRLADVFVQVGELETGLAMVDTAIGRYVLHTTDPSRPELLRAKAGLLAARSRPGDQVAAEALLIEALGQSRAQGTRMYELRIATDLARLTAGRDGAEAAASLLRPVVATFGEALVTPDLTMARGLLTELAASANATAKAD